MAFIPASFSVIRDRMIAFIQAYTSLTDFEVGSVIRTIIEAAALEDDEQYFQMVQLLDAFSIQNAVGQDLDNRLADYGLLRLQPAGSAGEVLIINGNLIKSTLTLDVVATGVSLTLASSLAFPTTGYPYNVRSGEGTLQVEDVAVSNNNTGTGVLTCSALVNAHNSGDRAAYINGAGNITLQPGIQVQIPATASSAAIKYSTTSTGTLVNGNYYSTALNATSINPGSSSNTGPNTITAFTSNPPFSGAQVINVTSFAGGRDIETDADFRDRGRAAIQSLSRGTVLALKQGALGVTDPVTGQRCVTSNVLEDFVNHEVILYIDDGTGFTPDEVTLARTEVSVIVNPGDSTVTVVDSSTFPGSGYIVASPENSATIELLQYSSVDYSTNVLTLVTPATNTHVVTDEIDLVDTIDLNTDPGQLFFNTTHFPVVRSSDKLWIDQGSGLVRQINGATGDYILNKGNGQIQLTGAGLPAGSIVVMNYIYYTGIIATVQTVIYGDPNNPVQFPGISAAGIMVTVENPSIRRISANLVISVLSGFSVLIIGPQVQANIEAYISSLGIGGDVILAELIQIAMNVTGVYNVIVNTPTSDLSVLENELPVPYDTNGNSLITVT